jgi:hypothetical protein
VVLPLAGVIVIGVIHRAVVGDAGGVAGDGVVGGAGEGILRILGNMNATQ